MNENFRSDNTTPWDVPEEQKPQDEAVDILNEDVQKEDEVDGAAVQAARYGSVKTEEQVPAQ